MRRGSQARATSYFVVAVVVAVLLLVLGQALRFDAVRGVAATIFQPFQVTFASTGGGIRDFIGTITSIGDTQGENRRLRQQVADLQRQLAASDQLQVTDQQLRDMLGLRNDLKIDTVSAQVIGLDPEAMSQSMTVSIGSGKGIKPGMSVLGQRGLVGRVTSVQPNSAQVRLVSDPSLPVNVELAKTHLGGTLKVRDNSLAVEMLGAPTDLKLDPGDILVTSGLGGNFPKGLPAAEISQFRYQPAQVTQVAQVAPLDDLNRLEYVMVDTDFVPN
ncbi:MAG: rod shape-determining protein MreC [Candidatus Dormiibacterota bacterium]